tara:strand:- start:255 stop:656 length:402 start_codon:yes stop_codon:yes gene_type:complete
MAKKYTDAVLPNAVRMATTSGLTRPELSSDLGVGLSTLNKWVQQRQHDDLMTGPHEDVERENMRLRKEVRLLREQREVLKRRQSSLHAKAGGVYFHRRLERRMVCGVSVRGYAGHIAGVPCLAGAPDEPATAG